VRVNDKTVTARRRKLESTSEIPKLNATRGKDGKTRKATRLSATPEKPEPKQANATACATQEEPAEERSDAQFPATPLLKEKPVKLATWWPRVEEHATTIEGFAIDLRMLAKSKPAERKPASVLELARQLRQTADDLESTTRGVASRRRFPRSRSAAREVHR
jgi:hypothetical protein